MTAEQLDEIEKLAEAATPGPWRAQLSDKGHALWGPLPNGECGSMRIALSSYAAFDRANMVFMEALRDAALPLVKALREARAALAALKEEHRPADELRSQLLAEIEAHAETKAEVERLRALLNGTEQTKAANMRAVEGG